MTGNPFRRRLVLLLLLAVLTAPGAWAADPLRGPTDRTGAPAALDLAARLWGWLTSVWSEEGCILDPNGRCFSGTGEEAGPAAQGDAGCIIDPNGRCIG